MVQLHSFLNPDGQILPKRQSHQDNKQESANQISNTSKHFAYLEGRDLNLRINGCGYLLWIQTLIVHLKQQHCGSCL